MPTNDLPRPRTECDTPLAADCAGPAAAFDWPLAAEGEEFLRRHIARFLEGNRFARRLGQLMTERTGTDLFEWTDHVVLSPEEEPGLQAAGFVQDPTAETPAGEKVYEHPQASLPRVLISRTDAGERGLAVRPEFVADFVGRHNLDIPIEGDPWSRYRRAVVSREGRTRLVAIERRAYRGFVPAGLSADELRAVIRARELWGTRPRAFAEEEEGFTAANRRLDQVLELVGRDSACELFFEAERAYWERRNRAGRIQKHRQDQLGLGWGNHDHHTFRSSRRCFAGLVSFFERLGLGKRERFYAGAEAGWGAQVMEQPVARIVVFADVDLLPEETRVDFSSRPLPPSARLGTVGLWVGLHGESLLQAGMHHLEARFDFEHLRNQLRQEGIGMMPPFSDFAFLKQAFTEGELWPVEENRLGRLLEKGLITPAQAEGFRREGALGSHLENLQRHGGFKGFNQKSVSVVIAATDPRRRLGEGRVA